MVGIVSSLPSALIEEYNLRVSSPLLLFIEFLLLCLVVSCTIMLNHAVRKIPLQYAREFTNTYFTISRRQYLPLKLISSGVMPIIFAQVMMFVFGFIFQLLSSYSDLCVDISRNLSESTSWSYNILFALLIILFSYMYVAININPMKVAEDMKHSSSFIPGIRPGKPTADYIDNMLSKLTLPGSILLACLAMLPALAYSLGICRSLSRFYGGSSLLILVSVIVECSQQIKSYLLLYRYDHIMDSGEIPTIS
jgi:preprotein translocase subunit SecY